MIERAVKRVGQCGGDQSSSTLTWLRALDECAQPHTVALATAEGALGAYVRTHIGLSWPDLRLRIAQRFINAAFQQSQRDAFQLLNQRPGETLTRCNYEFSVLLSEAFDELPSEQGDLVRTYLSALRNRDFGN